MPPDYGKVLNTDRSWMVDEEKMRLTDNAFSCTAFPSDAT